jgi:hypothetical protein
MSQYEYRDKDSRQSLRRLNAMKIPLGLWLVKAYSQTKE